MFVVFAVAAATPWAWRAAASLLPWPQVTGVWGRGMGGRCGVLTMCWVCHVCKNRGGEAGQASRAAHLTGRYPVRCGCFKVCV